MIIIFNEIIQLNNLFYAISNLKLNDFKIPLQTLLIAYYLMIKIKLLPSNLN